VFAQLRYITWFIPVLAHLLAEFELNEKCTVYMYTNSLVFIGELGDHEKCQEIFMNATLMKQQDMQRKSLGMQKYHQIIIAIIAITACLQYCILQC